MFNNMGSRIKTVTVILCWISMITFVIIGIVMISKGSKLNNDYYARGAGDGLIAYGVILMIAGPIAAWIGSLAMYALGQIAENSDKQTELITKAIEEYRRDKRQDVKRSGSEIKSGNTTVGSPVSSSDHEAVPQKNGETGKPVSGGEKPLICKPILLEDGQEQCEYCGTIQRAGRAICWNCGTTFIRDNDKRDS